MTKDVTNDDCDTLRGRVKIILSVIMLANEHRVVAPFETLAKQDTDWHAVASAMCPELHLKNIPVSCASYMGTSGARAVDDGQHLRVSQKGMVVEYLLNLYDGKLNSIDFGSLLEASEWLMSPLQGMLFLRYLHGPRYAEGANEIWTT